MCISRIRVVRPVDEAPVKELLKEFFRLIGCLYYDNPVHSREEGKEALRQVAKSEVDLVLNIDPDLLDRDAGHCEQGGSFVRFSEEGKDGRRAIFISYVTPERERRKFYEKLIYALIDAIWHNFPVDQTALREICTLYLEKDLFGFSQSKRAFRVAGMGEVLDIAGMREMPIPYSREPEKGYIRNMLNAFDSFYKALKEKIERAPENEAVSIYLRYAKINAARKVKEILSVLDWRDVDDREKDEFGQMLEYCDTVRLLTEIKGMYGQDQNYLGIFFLAANICQGDPKQRDNAGYYYEQLFEFLLSKDQEKCQEAYAFAYYEYGRYLEKVGRSWERAILYYNKAERLDPLNYHAMFKIACYMAKKGDYDDAKAKFAGLIQVIINHFCGSENKAEGDVFASKKGWDNLSLKGIQYLFKANVWLCKIYAYQNMQLGANICVHNMKRFLECYKKNACVARVYGADSQRWDIIDGYHKSSWAVTLLDYVLKEMMKLVRYEEYDDQA